MPDESKNVRQGEELRIMRGTKDRGQRKGHRNNKLYIPMGLKDWN